MIIRVPRKPVEKTLKPKIYKRSKNALIKDLRKIGFFQLNGEENFIKVRKCLPTGLFGLDVISAIDINGVYGLPFGKQIEISGKQDSGKTSLMYHLAAIAQKQGHIVCWLETEDSINETRLTTFGADINTFLLETPEYLEEALNIIKKTVLRIPKYTDKNYRPNNGLVIFWDSVAATPTKNEFRPKPKDSGEKEFSSKDSVAEFARLMSKYQRKIKRNISKRDVLIVYCNQLKDKIGMSWGDKTQTYGGNALRFHSAIRLKISYTGKLRYTSGDKKGEIRGITVKIENKKNKILLPWGVIEELEFDFTKGFNQEQALLYGLQYKGLAEKSGTKYKIYNLDTDKDYTMKDFEKLIRNNPHIKRKLVESVYVLG